MVRIQVKHMGSAGDGQKELEFLYDCEVTFSVDEIAEDIREIANLQLQIQRLAVRLLHHPLLSPANTTNAQLISLSRAVSEAFSYASKDQVLHNKPLSVYVLKDHLRSIDTEFRTGFRELGFADSSLQQLFSELDIVREGETQLWWAGKELTKGRKLSEYIGRNDKTKIVLRLKSAIQGPEGAVKM